MGAFFKNFLESVLAAGIDNDDTTLVVTTGHGSARFNHTYSSANYLPLAIWDATAYPNPADAWWAGAYEIVHVTGRSSDTLTIVRGRHGTTAQSWSTGAKISNTIAAEFLNDLNQRSSGDFKISGDQKWFPPSDWSVVPDGVVFVWAYDKNVELPPAASSVNRVIFIGAAQQVRVASGSGDTLNSGNGFGSPMNFGGRSVILYCWSNSFWSCVGFASNV